MHQSGLDLARELPFENPADVAADGGRGALRKLAGDLGKAGAGGHLLVETRGGGADLALPLPRFNRQEDLGDTIFGTPPICFEPGERLVDFALADRDRSAQAAAHELGPEDLRPKLIRDGGDIQPLAP